MNLSSEVERATSATKENMMTRNYLNRCYGRLEHLLVDDNRPIRDLNVVLCADTCAAHPLFIDNCCEFAAGYDDWNICERSSLNQYANLTGQGEDREHPVGLVVIVRSCTRNPVELATAIAAEAHGYGRRESDGVLLIVALQPVSKNALQGNIDEAFDTALGRAKVEVFEV